MLDLLVIAPSSARWYQRQQTRFSAIESNVWGGMLAGRLREKSNTVDLYNLEGTRTTLGQLTNHVRYLDRSILRNKARWTAMYLFRRIMCPFAELYRSATSVDIIFACNRNVV